MSDSDEDLEKAPLAFLPLKEAGPSDIRIILRLYDQASEPASRVPIAPLMNALQEPGRNAFEENFAAAIIAGLFDGKGLEFLFECNWIPLDSVEFNRIINKFDTDIVRNVYILKASLPLAVLQEWAAKFDIGLPRRFDQNVVGHGIKPLVDERAQDHAEPATQVSEAEDDIDGLKKQAKPSGRPPHPDKERMFQYAQELISSGEYASKEDRSQTKKKFVEAVLTWMQDNAFENYSYDYLEKLLQPLWRGTRQK